VWWRSRRRGLIADHERRGDEEAVEAAAENAFPGKASMKRELLWLMIRKRPGRPLKRKISGSLQVFVPYTFPIHRH
jgi:hypothetical protein